MPAAFSGSATRASSDLTIAVAPDMSAAIPALCQDRFPGGRGSVARVPLPESLARFNKKATNRAARVVAGWAPGMGIIHHVGRKSGRRYQTPVNVFRKEGGYLFALTYGDGTDWLANVLAAGECVLETRGERFRLVNPIVYTDSERKGVPAPVRFILGFVNVDQFLMMGSMGRV